MMSFIRNAAAAILALASLALATPVNAQVNAREPDPAVWLKSVYDLYVRAEKDEKLQKTANYRLVVARASKSFAALWRKNDACEKKEQGVCAIDWDFIVNGQDNRLSEIKVSPTQTAGEKATVTVDFKNFDSKNHNTFYFVKEGGVWKVEDIETKSDAEAPNRIAKILREFKP
ncbi:DUF3828 domain-containing protein [Terrarubrum flagellatum]|uniref:DUF3828 domain-containing protein n=1 Tax=Terrirubrum flagellatum TaxID=2895980 RepID=UPI0031451D78